MQNMEIQSRMNSHENTQNHIRITQGLLQKLRDKLLKMK